MHIPHRTMRALAWTAIAITAAEAQHVMDTLSFGHKDGTISPNLRAIPNWHISGEGHSPQMLSDRIILTPPTPGNKRGAIWSDNTQTNPEWTSELYFRVSGPERGGGNLQLWYVRDQNQVGTGSLATVKQFDGLVLVIDQYGGRGGTIRGFLNDGRTSYKDHHSVDSLAFGQCDFSYRNLGRFSMLQVKHTATGLEVTYDNRPCFKSEKIKLPTGYKYGITAASAENPDSFEITKFLTSSTSAPHQDSQPPQGRNEAQKPVDVHQPPPIPDQIPDVIAASIKSQEMQFADIHNRIQVINHQVNNIFKELEELRQRQEERHSEVMSRVVPVDERMKNLERMIQNIERVVTAVQKDVESKDYKAHLTNLQNTLKDTHKITQDLPHVMSHTITSAVPRMGVLVLIFVAVQVVLIALYQFYKKRRGSVPKKYL